MLLFGSEGWYRTQEELEGRQESRSATEPPNANYPRSASISSHDQTAPDFGSQQDARHLTDGAVRDNLTPIAPDRASAFTAIPHNHRAYQSSMVVYISGVFIMNRNSCTAALDSGRRLSIPS